MSQAVLDVRRWAEPHRRDRTMSITGAVVAGVATVAGPTEGRGPLGAKFDEVTPDHLLGCRTWEQAESALVRRAFTQLSAKLGWREGDFDLLLAGDLLDQTVASSFAARDLDIPLLGLFSACGTFAEGLGLAALLCSSGACRRVLVTTSSHHDTAERQYRFPTELGNQRPPTAQWTATGAVAVAVTRTEEASGPRITAFTPGRVMDFGVRDPFQMGGAMAPAAADTLSVHLVALGLAPEDFSIVCTGDLGRVGVGICEELLERGGMRVKLRDCGQELYDPSHQDVHAGGSGAACSALVFAAKLLGELGPGGARRLCLCGTGSLHSPTTYQQGASIPAVAHAVTVEAAG